LHVAVTAVNIVYIAKTMVWLF